MANFFEKIKREFQVYSPEAESTEKLFPKSPFMDILVERCRQGNIDVETVGREKWDEMISEGGIFSQPEKSRMGKVKVFVPSGMQTWELSIFSAQVLDQIENMDQDRRQICQQDLQKTGLQMRDLALYIEKFSGDMEKGIDMKNFFCSESMKMATGFLEASGQQVEKDDLSPADITNVENMLRQWGFEVTHQKVEKLQAENPESVDDYRRKKVAQYFDIQEKVLEKLDTEDYGKFQHSRRLIKILKSAASSFIDVKELFGIYKKNIALSPEGKQDFARYLELPINQKQFSEMTEEDRATKNQMELDFFEKTAGVETRNGLPWQISTKEEQYFKQNHRGLLKVAKASRKEFLKTLGAYKEERLENALGTDQRHTAEAINSLPDLTKDQKEMMIQIGSLDIPQKKQELKELKEGLDQDLSESERKELLTKIGEKEVRFAEEVQNVVGGMEYQSGKDGVRDIWEQQQRNCVGASLLGGAILRDIGIDYIQCGTPSHSFIIIATTDDRLRLTDMVTSHGYYYNMDIGDDDLRVSDQKETGTKTKERLLKVARGESDQVIDFDVVGKEILEKNKQTFAGRAKNNTVTAYPSEEGILVHNLIWDKISLDSERARNEANQLILSTGSNHEHTLSMMAGSFLASGQENIAEIYYKKALNIEPDYAGGYFLLAQLYKKRGEYEKAKACFMKVLEVGDRKKDKSEVWWANKFLGLENKKSK